MSHNTLLHQAIRPIVKRVARTGMHPNHVTATRIAVALTAITLFSIGSRDALIGGAVLFVCSAILDRADGELARQTGRFSRFGHWLDLIADCSTDALALLALGIGAHSGPLGEWSLVFGGVAAVSVGWLFYQLNSHKGAPQPSSRRLIDPDDAILLLPICVVVFGATPTLALAGTVTPVIATYAAVYGLKL